MMQSNWNMIGHEWAANMLQTHLANGRWRHAYLITGPQGVGRRTLALRLAQALNCPNPPDVGMPCGTCRTCQLFERMEHPDLTVVAADKIVGILKVDQIREVQHRLSLSPYEARYRVALFLRFEEANLNAANALLKTLEEPPARVVMILTAQDSESLLPTIISRCELIRLRTLSIEQTQNGLVEQFQLPANEAQLLAHISGGRPGYAVRHHQAPDLLDLRTNSIEELFQLLAANRVERFNYAENLAKDKDRGRDILQIWASVWRDVLLANSQSAAKLTNPDYRAEILSVAAQVTLPATRRILNRIEETQKQIDRFINARLTLEVLMLDLPQLAQLDA